MVRQWFFVLMVSIGCAPAVFAESPTRHLHLALADMERISSDMYFIGYQSVELSQPDQYGVKKYMVLDFRFAGQLAHKDTDAQVRRICRRVLDNPVLLKDLSSMGYEMVSVAFDEAEQFDCL
ncbi:hypothetical protein HCH_00310 [Hahella chejuensis KCTC 2396]|uniref:Uncharacterized protein n=1 Tax=Hahella chejuensis (strain KCTC 2396) TaxID=349521 RepID=Q2SQ52_HAHCH|nr:hypothetical protein [Hahella chejuensis]ABC27222.1 hypothetical protein HCH_00310 [Hahella chejuensis KCTC 2396]